MFLLPSFLRPIRRFLSRWALPGLEGSKAGFEYVRKVSNQQYPESKFARLITTYQETIAIVSNRWLKHRSEGQSERADILGTLMDAKDPQTQEKMEFQELATNASTNV